MAAVSAALQRILRIPMTYVQPVLPLVVLALAAALVARRFDRWRRAEPALLWAAFAALAVWSSPPAAKLFYRTLEADLAPADSPPGDAEAIVVFGGGLEAAYAAQPQPLAGESTYRRAMHAAWLYRRGRPLPVFVSGGPSPGAGDTAIADVARRVLEGAGVPPERIHLERRSTSTLENAVYTSELLRRHGIKKVVLVTDGYHMRRARACLRRQGIEVSPAPCSLRRLRPFTHWRQYLPGAEAMSDNEAALHEWIALAWYWVTGRI
jgi:uncharacterized SAM-binding protein YcdF (DUF218 family)